MEKAVNQGEIWLVDLEPAKGGEMRKIRPCAIISRSKINASLDTMTVIPITSGLTDNRILRINIKKDDQNGLEKDSHLEIVQIRTISSQRCKKRLGHMNPSLFQQIKESFYEYFWKDLHHEKIVKNDDQPH